MTEPARNTDKPGLLGQRLIARGAITEEQLALALREQARLDGRLGDTLITLGFTTEEEIQVTLGAVGKIAERVNHGVVAHV